MYIKIYKNYYQQSIKQEVNLFKTLIQFEMMEIKTRASFKDFTNFLA